MRRPAPPKAFVAPAGRPPRFLLVRLSALGDVIHAFPALAALRRHQPDATIDWAVEDRFVNLVTARPEVDRIIALPRKALRGGRLGRVAPATRHFLTELRARSYDAALDLQGNLKSGLVTRLARAAVRFGIDRSLAKEGNHLFTTRRALPAPDTRHRVERNLSLLSRFLGVDLPWTDPGLPEDAGAAARARAALRAAGAPARDYVVLQPGTSRFGAFKRWPPARFRDLAGALVADGERIVVPAPPGEEALAAAVGADLEGAYVVPVRDLLALAEVLRHARLVVAGDTGPLHLAALAGTPVYGLFGPKDPGIYGPYGRRPDGTAGVLDVHVREDVACRPCRLRRCADPICMTGMDPDAVRAGVRAVIRRRRPDAARA